MKCASMKVDKIYSGGTARPGLLVILAVLFDETTIHSTALDDVLKTHESTFTGREQPDDIDRVSLSLASIPSAFDVSRELFISPLNHASSTTSIDRQDSKESILSSSSSIQFVEDWVSKMGPNKARKITLDRESPEAFLFDEDFGGLRSPAFSVDENAEPLLAR
eukprot:CAMPEP_0185032732 /NCGR_PEP_ID=MMETSP1103-20130426/21056_1 /TAXON_ID=36769 /ORGANISM="Paraphysomonas bandaiensis, Strain Caron Lab Isolate" /LENGTH=163 /DNA_ID=CAMNT_0027568727 /DNA_START=1262 /DNA_END=1753 /DNA_ORIENTATION=+